MCFVSSSDTVFSEIVENISTIRNIENVSTCLGKGVWETLVESLSCIDSFATPWTVDCQVPQPMDFLRQEYWSGLPFPSPGNLSYPEMEPASPALAGRFFRCWRKLLKVPWTARRLNQSILKEINPEYSLEHWCWSWIFNILITWWEDWKKSWCWERLKAKGGSDGRGWGG